MFNIFTFIAALLILLAVVYLRYLYLVYSIPQRIEKAKQLFVKDEARAVAILNSILSLDRGNTIANWLMANFHIRHKRYILALMFLNEIINFARYSPEVSEQDVRETITQLYLNLGNIEKALAQFYILSNKYELPVSLIKKAVTILLEAGNVKDAKIVLEKTAEVKGSKGELDFVYATVLYKEQDYIRSETKLNIAIRKGYTGSDCFFLLGRIQFADRRYDQVIASLNRVNSNEVDAPMYYNLLGQSYFYVGSIDLACSTFEAALPTVPKDDPNLSQIQFFLAEVYERKNRIEEAIPLWEAVEHTSKHKEEAKQKLNFYNNIAQKKYERDIITGSTESFKIICEELLEKMKFKVQDNPRDERNCLEFVCSSTGDTMFHNYHYVSITRAPSPINETSLKDLQIRKNVNKCKFLVVVGAYFSEGGKHFAKHNGIQIYNLSVFKKFKIV